MRETRKDTIAQHSASRLDSGLRRVRQLRMPAQSATGKAEIRPQQPASFATANSEGRMNMIAEPLPQKARLFEQTKTQFWNRVKAARKLITHSEQDIARFENLCECIAEHNIQFTREVFPLYINNDIAYRILMSPEQSRLAGEMKLTLEALGCTLTPFQSIASQEFGSGTDEMYIVCGEHAPDFYLHISRSHYRNSRHG